MSDPLAALRAVSGEDPATTSAGLPNIPAVPFTNDYALANFLQAAKLWMEKAKGEGMTGFATKADLVRNKVLATDENGNIIPGTGRGETPNLAIPPVPTGLTASGAMTSILVGWDDPSAAYGNHGYTEVWAAESDNFTGAVMVGESGGFLFSHAVGEDATRYYWVRFVSTAGIKGPYNAVGGTMGVTSKNAAYLLSVLTGELGEQPFYELTEDTIINGVLVPAGVYMKTAYIADASITNAKIGSLSADKITTGKLTADRIDGTNLSVVNGTFSGVLSGARGTFSGELDAATGSFSGALNAATGTFGGALLAGVIDFSSAVGTTLVYNWAPGTFYTNVPADKTSMRISLLGGGGGGGGAGGGGSGRGGGGGGSYGGTKFLTVHNLAPNTQIAIVVGSGGPGGAGAQYVGTAGSAGGPTVLYVGGTEYARASGGGGGGGSNYATGGSGGYTDGTKGGADGANHTSGVWGSGGRGGSSAYGAGGAGGTPGSWPGTGAEGGIGGGGGGGAGMYDNPGGPGGTGGRGMAIVEFFNPNGVILRTEYMTLITALQRQGIQTV